LDLQPGHKRKLNKAWQSWQRRLSNSNSVARETVHRFKSTVSHLIQVHTGRREVADQITDQAKSG